ncbi:hypothetical protein N7540_007905 [Penicillium herquei]|nr:hypothetical protein N7540_007905 [Penicillium herquei]
MTMMKLITAFAALGTAHAYLISPPGTAFPGANSECSEWVSGSSGLTCAEVEAKYYLTEGLFYYFNPNIPLLSDTCELLSGFYYCVDIDFLPWSEYTPSSAVMVSTSTSASSSLLSFQTVTTTATASANVTSSSSQISTPSPIQTGMTSTCDEFYLVVSGDDCATIASAANITLDEFYAWNPAVGSTCANLWVDDYVCIDSSVSTSKAVTVTATAKSTASTTISSSDQVSTPSPIQTGMTSACDEFYLVVSGDTCAAILSTWGITLAQFYAWNPAVGSTCANLWVDDYVCVDSSVATSQTVTTTAASTTTTSSDGVSTPSPIQTGMTSTCDEFYLVASGDTCAAILSTWGITLAQFYAWNPAVGSTCTNLWVDDYVCVDASS